MTIIDIGLTITTQGVHTQVTSTRSHNSLVRLTFPGNNSLSLIIILIMTIMAIVTDHLPTGNLEPLYWHSLLHIRLLLDVMLTQYCVLSVTPMVTMPMYAPTHSHLVPYHFLNPSQILNQGILIGRLTILNNRILSLLRTLAKLAVA